jgi:hypothetical protein
VYSSPSGSITDGTQSGITLQEVPDPEAASLQPVSA